MGHSVVSLARGHVMPEGYHDNLPGNMIQGVRYFSEQHINICHKNIHQLAFRCCFVSLAVHSRWLLFVYFSSGSLSEIHSWLTYSRWRLTSVVDASNPLVGKFGRDDISISRGKLTITLDLPVGKSCWFEPMIPSVLIHDKWCSSYSYQ